MVGAIGTDAHASVGLSGLQAAGVDLSQVREVEGPTGLAIVTVAQDGENSIVVIPGANSSMDAGRVSAAGEMISRAAIVVCQGEIPRSGIEALPSLITGRFLHNPAPVMELDRSEERRVGKGRRPWRSPEREKSGQKRVCTRMQERTP